MKKLTLITALLFLFAACDKDKSSSYNSDEERIIGEWYLVKVTSAWGQESILTDNGYTETRKFNNDEMTVYFNDTLYMTYNYELQSEATANGLNALMVDENVFSTYSFTGDDELTLGFSTATDGGGTYEYKRD